MDECGLHIKLLLGLHKERLKLKGGRGFYGQFREFRLVITSEYEEIYLTKLAGIREECNAVQADRQTRVQLK